MTPQLLLMCSLLVTLTPKTTGILLAACQSNPCSYGTCLAMNNNYHCHCFAGYTGKQCSQDIDDCSPINPCKSGTCIDRVNGFTCSCPTGVTGLRCDVCENNHPNCTIPTNKLCDCKDVYDSGQWRGIGVYTINGFGKTSVLCDRTPDGKIWTVLMYRHDASLNFTDKNYTDYIFGFGNKMSDFWEGLDNMHKMTSDGRRYQLRVDLTAANGSHYFALYDDFSIGPLKDFTLHVGKYSGTAGDSLSGHTGLGFTTPGHDVDTNVGINCADYLQGSWWFHDCYDSCLTCPFIVAKPGTEECASMSWNGVRYCEPLRAAKMMIRPM